MVYPSLFLISALLSGDAGFAVGILEICNIVCVHFSNRKLFYSSRRTLAVALF
jgi:hypothetical protein